MTSAICQEFGCAPSQAKREDIGECLDIMSLRRYAEVWKAIDDGMSQEDLAKHFDSRVLETVMLVQVKRLKGEL